MDAIEVTINQDTAVKVSSSGNFVVLPTNNNATIRLLNSSGGYLRTGYADKGAVYKLDMEVHMQSNHGDIKLIILELGGEEASTT